MLGLASIPLFSILLKKMRVSRRKKRVVKRTPKVRGTTGGR